MVERKYGSLPQKRSVLYQETVELLIERWNQQGHKEQHVDLDETRYHLAYIAFHMMANHSRIAPFRQRRVVNLFDNPDVSLQKVILYYLGYIRDYTNELIDFQDYLSALIRYVNNAKEIPCGILDYAAEIYENHTDVDCAIPLRSDAVRAMIATFRWKEYLFQSDYDKLLTFGLLAAVSHAEPEMTAQVFSLITEIQNRMLSRCRLRISCSAADALCLFNSCTSFFTLCNS